MNANQRMSRPPRRRGVAMLLVLGVIAIASVLSWAMLSATTVRAKVAAVSNDSLEAAYQADSGVSYALYYLRYPEKSPVARQPGAYGTYNADNTFYPGQTGLTMWANAKGKTDVAVTNTGDGLFSIRSTSSVAGLTRTTLAEAAYTYDRYTVDHALALNNVMPFNVPSNMTVNGAVVTRGGVIALPGRIVGSPPVTPAGKAVTPVSSELALADEIASAVGSPTTDRPYTFDGVTYYAERVSGTITGTPTSAHPATNPKNVFWANSNIELNNATINGTLVVLDGKTLTVTGPNTINAMPEMHGLTATGTIDMKTTTVTSRLTVNGVVWAGGQITDSGAYKSPDGWLRINGALLMGSATPTVSVNYRSKLEVNYHPSALKVAPMSKVKAVNGVAVRGWRTETN